MIVKIFTVLARIYGSKQIDQVQRYSSRTRFVYYSYKSLATCAINYYNYSTCLVLKHIKFCTCAGVYSNFCV